MLAIAARVSALVRAWLLRRRLLSSVVTTVRSCDSKASFPLLYKPSPAVTIELQDKEGLVRIAIGLWLVATPSHTRAMPSVVI